MSAADHRTVGELLADSDALARETLLDTTPDHAPAMVPSWNHLVEPAANLRAVLPSAPDSTSGSDPMEQLQVVGEAIGRSITIGHWPGHGPTDEHLTEIADNFPGRGIWSSAVAALPSERMQADTRHAHGKVMHTLYVAAHGTAVAVGAYVTDLQHRLEVGTRPRQPMAERPTTLEITAAQGMIARFSGFEQLAPAYLTATPNPDQLKAATPGTRLATALAAGEVQAHRALAASPDPADLVRVARVQALITSTTSILTQAAVRKGHVDGGILQRLAPALEAEQVAWSRLAKRWGQLTSPASCAAIAATATNPTGWATPDQLASRIDLPKTVKTLQLSMVASSDLAYVLRDTAADHPGLTAPARIIGMRSQGEAEIAIEQGGVPARTDQLRRRRHRRHQPGRGRSTRPQRCHAINQIRS